MSKKGCGNLIFVLILFAIVVGMIGKHFEGGSTESSYTPSPQVTYKNPVVVVTPTPTPAVQKPASTPEATKKPTGQKPTPTPTPAAGWDVCGTYRLSNSKIDAVVEIRNFEWLPDESFTVTYSYTFTSHVSNDDLFNGPKMVKDKQYTGGPVTFTDDLAFEKKYVKINVDGLVDMYICGESVNWDPIGPGTGVWIKVKGNYAKTYGEYWLYR